MTRVRNRSECATLFRLAAVIEVLAIFGTRPEAIKLCPVVRALRQAPERFRTRVCVTAQHRELLDQVLDVFAVRPDYDLDLMRPGQTLASTTARIFSGLEPVLGEAKPDIVLVQGDTTTTFCGAVSAFYQRVPVGHVEAGLRTGDLRQPFPEEFNRLVTTRVTEMHFAPTARAAANLRREGVPEQRIHVTGNTSIDAVLYIAGELAAGRLEPPRPVELAGDGPLVVATAHRRESFGAGLEGILRALGRLAAEGVRVAFLVHPNPNVRRTAERILAGSSVTLLDPLDYVSFVDLMRRADLLITDSGGIQEEGPALGKPVLVAREKTERPEAVEAGGATLVGVDTGRIYREAVSALRGERRPAAGHNPFGDGRASMRIASAIDSFFGA